MPGKKPKTTQKKMVKTKKVKKTSPRKTSTVKRTGKKIISGSGAAHSRKKATKEGATKKRKIIKKPTKKTTKARTAKATKVSTATRVKKKLSPRERAIQEIKSKLMEQRNDLLSEAEEALNQLPGQTIFPDLGDQASAEIDRSFMLRLRGREQRLLKKIEEAIEKIDSGSFGVCEVCGEDIDVKRLEARPVTTMCIACKTEQEEEERLRGA